MGWVALLQRLEQQIQRALVLVVLLHHPRTLQHEHQHFKILLLFGRFAEQVQHQRGIQCDLRLLPKRVIGCALGRRGVFHQVVHQLQHIRLVPNISERIITVRLVRVDQVKYLDVVPFFLQ